MDIGADRPHAPHKEQRYRYYHICVDILGLLVEISAFGLISLDISLREQSSPDWWHPYQSSGDRVHHSWSLLLATVTLVPSPRCRRMDQVVG